MIAGKRVVVTGKVEGHSRATAEAALRDAGAIVQSAVTGETDVLVTGAKVGATKVRKAEALGVAVVPWEQAFNGWEARNVSSKVERATARSVAPMLAKAAGEMPGGPEWAHEIKWDGYRGIATVKDGAVALQSRSGKSDYVEQFPGIVEQLATFPDCVLDGELVVLDAQGGSSIESMGKGEPSYIVFDLLSCPPQGSAVKQWPLRVRKALLHELIKAHGTTRITESPVFGHEDSLLLLELVKARGLEGVVSKRLDSTYAEGSRTGAWLKIKVRNRQEFAVLGWMPGEGAMTGAAGSLILGVFEDGHFRYVGRVGTGGDYALWQSFTTYANDEQGPTPALELAGWKPPATAVWLSELFVVEVEYQRWTADRRLWHPSVVAVRDDKKPAECGWSL